MGNANGREDGSDNDPSGRSIDEDNINGPLSFPMNPDRPIRVPSSDSMGANSPPASPGPSRSPLMFAPQVTNILHKYFHANLLINYLCVNLANSCIISVYLCVVV
ncbi:galactose metabolism-related protein [Ranunculus cassubicifolius]